MNKKKLVLHPDNVGELVKWGGEKFPKGQTSATQAKPLVELMESFVDMTERAGRENNLAFSPQWHKDFARYKARVAKYREVLDRELDTDPHAVTSDAVQIELLDPIIYGWFEGVDVRRPPDLATGLILTNQARVSDEAMQEAADQLWRDLNPLPKAKKAGLWAFAGAAFVGITGALALAFGKK